MGALKAKNDGSDTKQKICHTTAHLLSIMCVHKFNHDLLFPPQPTEDGLEKAN